MEVLGVLFLFKNYKCGFFQDNGREALDLTASPLRAPPAPNNRTNHPPMVIQGDFRKVIRDCHVDNGTEFDNCRRGEYQANWKDITWSFGPNLKSIAEITYCLMYF